MSYIERDVALNAIQNLPSVCGCSAIDRDEAENAIMTLPAADVVKVVRCKDCKHGQRNGSGELIGHYICEYDQDGCLKHPMHYCNHGEKCEVFRENK